MEGKVNWHFICSRCQKNHDYGMFAGSPINLCGKCKEAIYNKAIEKEVDSHIDGETIYFTVEGIDYSSHWYIFNGIDKGTIEKEEE